MVLASARVTLDDLRTAIFRFGCGAFLLPSCPSSGVKLSLKSLISQKLFDNFFLFCWHGASLGSHQYTVQIWIQLNHFFLMSFLNVRKVKIGSLAAPADRQRSFSNAESSVVVRCRRRRPSASTVHLKSLISQKLSNNFVSNFASRLYGMRSTCQIFWSPQAPPKWPLWLFLDILPNLSKTVQ